MAVTAPGFRRVLSEADWARLPAAVRRRFCEPGRVDVFVGEIAACRLSTFARLFDAISGLMGAPLPVCAEIGATVVVSVVDDGAGGQLWTRLFHTRRGFPRVLRSRMRFDGPSGLEEGLGFGLTMVIYAQASAQGLHFASRYYALRWGPLRLRLPDWLGPGAMQLDHLHRGEREFSVAIAMTHPWFGAVLSQTTVFRETAAQASSQSLNRESRIAHSP